jgi:TatA/E family protein of Tat protein translocase
MLASPVDVVLVAGVALLLLGPKRLPEFGRSLGKGIGDFKKALAETQKETDPGVDSFKSSGSSK